MDAWSQWNIWMSHLWQQIWRPVETTVYRKRADILFTASHKQGTGDLKQIRWMFSEILKLEYGGKPHTFHPALLWHPPGMTLCTKSKICDGVLVYFPHYDLLNAHISVWTPTICFRSRICFISISIYSHSWPSKEFFFLDKNRGCVISGKSGGRYLMKWHKITI